MQLRHPACSLENPSATKADEDIQESRHMSGAGEAAGMFDRSVQIGRINGHRRSCKEHTMAFESQELTFAKRSWR
jgi:hypothetical protein